MNQEKTLTIKKCYKLLDKYKTPQMVIAHAESVAKVSYYLSKKFLEKGINVDIKKIVYASILHDTFKIVEIEDYNTHISKSEVEEKKAVWDKLKKEFSGKNHEEVFELVFSKEYPIIAKIVANHEYSQIHSNLDSWEQKILFYADKLADFNKITTLKERMDNAHERYSKKYPKKYENTKYIDDTDKKIVSLEKEIFKITSLTPGELIKLNNINFNDLIKKDFEEEI